MCRTGGGKREYTGHMFPKLQLVVRLNAMQLWRRLMELNTVQTAAYGVGNRFFNESGHSSGGTIYMDWQFNLTGDSLKEFVL